MIINLFESKKYAAKIVLLDRDGTVNIDEGYISHPSVPRLSPNFLTLIDKFDLSNMNLVIVSNQSGIARGYFSYEQLFNFNEQLLQILECHSLNIDAILFCPHSPMQMCSCRKPKPQMISVALQLFGVVPKDAIFIGNADSDCEAATLAGVKYLSIDDQDILEKLTDWTSG